MLKEDRITEFLMEDIGQGDITSAALIEEGQKARARIYLKEEAVAAGLEEAGVLFSLLGCSVKTLVEEGVRVPADETLMEVEGPARAILSGERTALNLLGRMSGIATAVSEAQRIVSKVNPAVRVAATRKTVPGLRELDKKAVKLGGGDTHRLRLDDCALIKDNHLELLSSIAEAVKRAREGVSFTKKIEVEVRSLEQAVEASEAGADIVMFDNMQSEEIRDCLTALEGRGLRRGRLFEASGGVTPENIAEYAGTGVDIISMGCLTHSVRSLNVKLEIEMV
ncbi:MAG: carboxylating nicotinate-nucleotide diphosphorylase [Candidatus Bathyarchaeota archaeon]|nr:MAG: carboxylating nicotinate-nucleotide diphosphorylase [Candidatus Bathyarchaeota archaeon]